MQRLVPVALIAGVAACQCVGASTSAHAVPVRYPTPQETRAEFEALCRHQEEGNDPYFGRAGLAERQARLAAGGLQPRLEMAERAQLAYDLVRLGEHQRALDEVELALERYRLLLGGAPSPILVGLLKLKAVAHYQLGEDTNCVALHSEASCILPIRPEGVHRNPEHARAAGDAFLEVLRLLPNDVNARWLLILSRMVSGDYPNGVPEALRPRPDAFETKSETEFPLWIDIAPRLGVDVSDLAGGGIMDDFDGDGRLDIVSSTSDPCGPMRAFRNDGEGGFTDVGATWALSSQLGGLNLMHADYDGDGDLDLLVLRGGWWGTSGRMRKSLLRNDLNGELRRFVDVTAAAGLDSPAYPTQAAAWADYDGDGDLDLAVGTEAAQVVIDPSRAANVAGNGYPLQLFRNNGDGTFTDVAKAAGIDDHSFKKGVAWGDYDNDGDEDLYLSTFGPKRLFRNRGDGSFEEAPGAAGAAGGERRTFATWFFDYDNDGDLDLYVSSFNVAAEVVAAYYLGVEPAAPPDTPPDRLRSNPFLFRNDGGRFTEISEAAGMGKPALVMGANFGDLDTDGWLDLYLGTGQPDLAALHPKLFYRNVHGERFEDLTFRSGLGNLQKGHGVAFGDLDGDGDEDLFEQLGGAFPFDPYPNALYLNPSAGNPSHRFIVLRLHGVRANRFGVGARVRLDLVDAAGGLRSLHRRVDSGGSFGGSSYQLEVGLGDAARIATIEITWPGSGTVDTFADVALDGYYLAVEGAATLPPLSVPALRFPLHPPASHADHSSR